MQCQSLYLLYLYIVTFNCTVYVCTSVVTQSTQVYSCISIIKAQRVHNNYKNIILKEPNKKPQRAHLGPQAPLWTTLR